MDDDSTSPTSMHVGDGLPSGSSLASNVVPYTDNEHQEMDKAVARQLGGKLEGREFSSPSVSELAYVLHEVIRGDDRLESKNLDSLISLFTQYPSLATKLEDAWRTGSYCHIRALGMCTNHG